MFYGFKKNQLVIFSLLACYAFGGSSGGDSYEHEETLMPSQDHLSGSQKRPTYTINFANVSIKEYIKFISKIANLNFVYNEQDLNFNITITSEEPTDLSNILSALIQVLRIHDLSLIDDGINLVINRAPNAPQIGTVISDQIPYDKSSVPVIVTRVFKIRNANPASLVAVLQSLLSQSAIIEISRETRHLIITDSAINIDKVVDLLQTLDAPQSPLEIDAYTAAHNSVNNLVLLATQIILPLSEGNPVIMVPQPVTNTIFIVSTPFLIEKTLAVLEDLDAVPLAKKDKILSGDNILLYQLQYKASLILEKALQQISENLEDLGYSPEGLLETLQTSKYIPETNSLLFTGDPITLKKVQEILSSVDVPGKPLPNSQNSSFYIYKPSHKSLHDLANIIQNFVKNLDDSNFSDGNLINTIKSLKILESSGTLIFTGDQQSVNEVQGIITTLDVPSQADLALLSKKFYLYHIKEATEEQLSKSLTTLAENLESDQYPDQDLISTIDNMKWLRDTHSILFTGSEKSLKQLQDLLPTFDVPSTAILDLAEFYMYTPANLQGQDLLNAVEALSKNLKESGLANPLLLKTLANARWIPASNSLVFTGPTDALNRIKTLMPTIDKDPNASDKVTVFVYHAMHIPLPFLSKALHNLEENLPKDDELHQLISTMKVADESHSLVFKGPVTSIAKLKEILQILDTQEQAHLAGGTSTYFIYKLKNTSGDLVIQELEKIVKNLNSSGFSDKDFINAIHTIEWIKSTNSLYVAGSPEALKKVKELFEEFDVVTQGQVSSDYLIYKPIHISGHDMLLKLNAIEKGLQSSGLSNPELLSSISTAQFIENNNTLIFTGTTASIEHIKNILAFVESEESGTSIKEFGKKTYLIYKLKYLLSSQLMGYLHSIAGDLLASKSDETSLAAAIESAKFIQETNSVIFTGTAPALDELQKVIAQFDIPSLAPQVAINPPQAYLVYQPQFQTAGALIQILHDFQTQLMNAGLQEPDLFHTISSLKLLEKTGSITIAGTDASVKQVEELLKKFDVSQGADQCIEHPASQDLSFLIYKLKYHQGSEIEDALKKIAMDLSKKQPEGSPKNDLAQSIESVQWIQVTNSLLGTGTPKSLSKLKNLIENIDTPLSQIFIEVLVIETDITHSLDFGLRWGSQGNYLNKLGYSTGAFPQFAETSSTTTDPLNSFNSTLQKVNASTTPTGSSIPFSTGFGLGVIGDLIYHKGKSYTALGSLIDAIRQDGDTTIVLSQKVITQDNKPATIFVGDNIPFTGSTVQNAGSNATVVSANLEYKDIGVSLNLTPRVGDNGLITISIDQEITEDLSSSGNNSTASTGSSSASGGSITNPNVFGITTSKTSMQTQATVPDRHFLVFSGMMRNTKVKQRTGIPCLGGLPIIGAAFSDTNTQIEKHNLIIFVRPEIITTFRVYKDITEKQEDLFRSQAIAEDFDQGLELVKSPDDE
jgi:type II secretory pathway component GspD/PulD (secretin)